MGKQGIKVTALLRLASVFAACGLGLTALGVAGLLNAIRGGPMLSVLSIVAALGMFGIAGYLIWGYGWLKKRPQLVRKAEQQAGEHKPDV